MRRVCFLFVFGLLLVSSGCEMLQWLKPHNLWKLNRQPSLGGDDAYFQIPPETTLRESAPIWGQSPQATRD